MKRDLQRERQIALSDGPASMWRPRAEPEAPRRAVRLDTRRWLRNAEKIQRELVALAARGITEETDS